MMGFRGFEAIATAAHDVRRVSIAFMGLSILWNSSGVGKYNFDVGPRCEKKQYRYNDLLCDVKDA